MGTYVSRSSGGAGGGSTAFERLQDFTKNSSTKDLMQVFDRYGNSDMAKLTDAEKLARAVAIDELSERSAIVYDRGTGAYSRNTEKQPVVNTENGSYRIDSFRTRDKTTTNSAGQSVVGGKERAVDGVSVLINGTWHPLKSTSVAARNVDAEYFKKHKR